ncbi:MAG TPA: hypothetical protein VGC41_04620 [Kofleriaceae bacterium]
MRAHVLISLVGLAACGVNQTPQPDPTPQLPSCTPNRDGQITADELPIALGATVSYYARANAMVNLTASPANIFDLSAESADDQVVAIGPVALGAQWYAASFPTGQFVVDAGSGLDGIYHQDDRALWLDGTGSQTDGTDKTLIRYADPVAILRFPLTDGLTYATTATLADATVAGLPFNGTDQVDVDVTGGDRLDVPYVQFSPVLRVRTHVTRTPTTGTPVVGKRTTIFMFECFGEVARAESNANEAAADFTSAAYVRRFALGEEVKP